MSRVGNLPIKIEPGVTITVNDGLVDIKGPKGQLQVEVQSGTKIVQEGDTLIVSRLGEDTVTKAKHGLVRALIASGQVGVTKGYERKLEVNGVGFKVALNGRNLKMALGFSHEVEFKTPEGIELTVDANVITVSGIDKQKVGQVAAEIRKLRKPEPYKGKGIKYSDEQIIKKVGKSAATGSAAA